MRFFYNSSTADRILYGNPKESKVWWKEILKKIPNVVTVLISIGTFYIGLVQYYYSQNLIDRRKYFNNYYDERFKALNELATSTAKIHLIIDPKDSLESKDIDSINKQLIIFDYARLVLDKNKPDSIILNDIEDYLNEVSYFLNNDTIRKDHLTVYKSQKKLLEDAGKIFANEKDSINSFNFKFFPFGESSGTNK